MVIDSIYSRAILKRRAKWEEFRKTHPRTFSALYNGLYKLERQLEYRRLYSRFRDFTMLERHGFVKNLALCDIYRPVKGAVVECGTWKGGMIAGIATLFNDDRDYFLYDSFQGLPPASDLDAGPDGYPAKAWQADLKRPEYATIAEESSLKVDASFAHEAMTKSGAKNVHIVPGWFNETLPSYPGNPIAILRADGDWYESTMDILTNLYQYVVPGGVIILDDYYYWHGCAKAVHDFLAGNKSDARISQFQDSYALHSQTGSSADREFSGRKMNL